MHGVGAGTTGSFDNVIGHGIVFGIGSKQGNAGIVFRIGWNLGELRSIVYSGSAWMEFDVPFDPTVRTQNRKAQQNKNIMIVITTIDYY